MGDKNTDGSAIAFKITTIAMILTLIFFFLVGFFVLFLHLYIRYNWIRRPITRRRSANSHFIFTAGEDSLPSVGLNPSILLSLPISIYGSNDSKEKLECAVCLSELNEGEKARMLPNCNHGFHLECIDMWFHSHSTCPLCRCPVGGEGLQGGKMMSISIPDRSNELFQSRNLSPLRSSRSPVTKIKSLEGLKVGSVRRILSREKMKSPGHGDLERGLVEYGEVNGEGSSGN